MIGFVILSHRGRDQLLRLVKILSQMFEDPPIACHHDFGQSNIDTQGFPENVKFVTPHIKTSWAKWSIVGAALRALELLYGDQDPDWFVLMSASDYPIKTAAAFRADLERTEFDAFMDYHDVGGQAEVEVASSDGEGNRPNPMLGYYRNDGIRRMKRRLYTGAEAWIPVPKRGAAGGWRAGRLVLHLPWRAPFAPYGRDFRCFYGDQWIIANRKVARILLGPARLHARLRRHLRLRSVPDETYYQTVIANAPNVKICRDNKRFAKWDIGAAHPRDLTLDDLPALLKSDAYFARKFAPEADVLDALDDVLLAGAAR